MQFCLGPMSYIFVSSQCLYKSDLVMVTNIFMQVFLWLFFIHVPTQFSIDTMSIFLSYVVMQAWGHVVVLGLPLALSRTLAFSDAGMMTVFGPAYPLVSSSGTRSAVRCGVDAMMSFDADVGHVGYAQVDYVV